MYKIWKIKEMSNWLARVHIHVQVQLMWSLECRCVNKRRRLVWPSTTSCHLSVRRGWVPAKTRRAFCSAVRGRRLHLATAKKQKKQKNAEKTHNYILWVNRFHGGAFTILWWVCALSPCWNRKTVRKWIFFLTEKYSFKKTTICLKQIFFWNRLFNLTYNCHWKYLHFSSNNGTWLFNKQSRYLYSFFSYVSGTTNKKKTTMFYK